MVDFQQMRLRLSILPALIGLLIPLTTPAQRERGELRLEVRDSQGASVPCAGKLVSELNQVEREFKVGSDGRSSLQSLPFGRYHLSIHAQGFADWSSLLEIHSEVPAVVLVTLGVAPVNTEIQVSDSE